VGAQKLALAILVGREEEGVVHLARRMADGEVERGEIVVVGLDIRPFGDGKAHVAEDRGDLVDDLADRVDAAALGRRLTHRQVTSIFSAARRAAMATSRNSLGGPRARR
jgi:hypothetical protein